MLYSCPFLFEAGHMFFVEVDAEVRIRQFSQYFSWQQGFELADDPCQARDGYNDIVEINASDEIPADLRIIQTDGIKVDIFSLTGESNPQSLDGDVADSATTLLEAKNIAFAMTSCVEGSARGIVIRCGQDTVSGRVMHLQSEFAFRI